MNISDIIVQYDVNTRHAADPVEVEQWVFADGTVIERAFGDWYALEVSENAIHQLETGLLEPGAGHGTRVSCPPEDGPNPYILACMAHNDLAEVVRYFEDGQSQGLGVPR